MRSRESEQVGLARLADALQVVADEFACDLNAVRVTFSGPPAFAVHVGDEPIGRIELADDEGYPGSCVVRNWLRQMLSGLGYSRACTPNC
jgi:hypothetical protein